MEFTIRINSDLVSSRSASSIGLVVIPTKSVSYVCLISSRLGSRISTILRLWEIRYTMNASFNLAEIPSCSNNPLMSKRSRGCCLSSAAIIFPANRSSNETTGTSAKPKASSAVLVILMTVGSYTVPRNTGDNSTFTTALPASTINRFTYSVLFNREYWALASWIRAIMALPMLLRSLVISSSDCIQFPIGTYTRSMSTESRGMFRWNKLIAVPPFRAKQGCSATKGRMRTSSSTCLKYGLLLSILDLLRNGDQKLRIKDAPRYYLTFTYS